MYHGHLAAGLVLKAFGGRDVSAIPILLGCGILDVSTALGILLGYSDVVPTTDVSKSSYLFADIRGIRWDHSLLCAALISIAFGVLTFVGLSRNAKTAALAAIAVALHWAFDTLVVTPRGMPLHPFKGGNATLFGRGNYSTYPYLSWAAETAGVALLCLVARSKMASRNADITSACLMVAVLSLSFFPTISPARMIAQLKLDIEPKSTIFAVVIMSGYVVPSLIIARLLDAADKHAIAKSNKAA